MSRVSERIFEKLDRFSNTIERFSSAMEKIPRVAEMAGVAIFAARASERVGGRAIDGAIGGIVADGLAHSQLAGNLIAGTALGAYFSAIGLLNILPFGLPVIADENLIGAGGTVLDPTNVYSGLEPLEEIVSIGECYQGGGTVMRVIPNTALCVCAFPPPDPGPDRPVDPNRPIGPGRITRERITKGSEF